MGWLRKTKAEEPLETKSEELKFNLKTVGKALLINEENENFMYYHFFFTEKSTIFDTKVVALNNC